jgi:hypothetical protein
MITYVITVFLGTSWIVDRTFVALMSEAVMCLESLMTVLNVTISIETEILFWSGADGLNSAKNGPFKLTSISSFCNGQEIQAPNRKQLLEFSSQKGNKEKFEVSDIKGYF